MDTIRLILLMVLRTQSVGNALLKQELEVKVLTLYVKYSFPYYLNFMYIFIEHLLGALPAWHLSDPTDIVKKRGKSLL